MPWVMPLPTRILRAFSTRVSVNFEAMPGVTTTREVAVQRWPVEPKAPCRMPSAASSRSASSRTTTGFFPPISAVTRTPRPAARWLSRVPISFEPVKLMARMRGSSTSRSPTALPGPVMTLRTPLGSPASTKASASRCVQMGVSEAGFKTTVQPATSAGAVFHTGIAKGKFHGVMSATGPTGWRSVKLRVERDSDGSVLPCWRKPSPA